jgi:hypothetical protein
MQPLDVLLDPRSLDLPARPVVERIEWYKANDQIGDPAFFITVVLAEGTSDDERHWQDLGPIERRLGDALSAAGYAEWPYFRFRTPTELEIERRAA